MSQPRHSSRLALGAAFLLVALPALSVRAQDAAPPDADVLAALNERAAQLDAHERAGRAGTEALRLLRRRDPSVPLHQTAAAVADRQADGWAVAFGRLNADSSEALVFYEAILDHNYEVRHTIAYPTPDARVGPVLDGVRALASLGPLPPLPAGVRYKAVPVPASESHLYVYLLPVSPAPDVHLLGSDHVFTYDRKAGRVVEHRPLHHALLTFDFRSTRPSPTVSTAVLGDLPAETAVLFARRRPWPAFGDANHYVVMDRWVFGLDRRGVSSVVSPGAFRALVTDWPSQAQPTEGPGLALTLPACSLWPGSAPPNLPSAWVVGDEAFLAFPVEHREAWTWYTPDTQDNSLEYGWFAYTGDGPGGGHAGFQLFKRPGTAPRTGTLMDLLAAGQASATPALELRSSVPSGPGTVTVTSEGTLDRALSRTVSVEACEAGVLVRIRGHEAFQTLFGIRPERLTLTVALPGQPYTSYKTQVEYR